MSAEQPEGRYTASRRALLALAALGGAGLALGPASAAIATADAVDDVSADTGVLAPDDGLTASACTTNLASHNEIWDALTYYEPTGAASTFRYNPTFYSRLETWLSFWYFNTPLSWGWPVKVWTYGAYNNRNDGCVSMHNYGRAFDLTRLYATVNGSSYRGFYARYDVWRGWTGSALTTVRKQYWATAASVHYHFKYVLTYPYNSDHWSHIHLDNQVSGSGNSTFSTGSRSQVLHAQACCTYIWGYPTTVDGVWGPQTSGNCARVMSRIGYAGRNITSGQGYWLAFNKATFRFGVGTQSY